MKKLKDVKLLRTEKFICAGCGTDFLLFEDRIKRYTYKIRLSSGISYYCRYNCWAKHKE